MKKIISTLVATTLLFTACGKKDEDKVKEIVSDTTITNIVNDRNLKNLHNLDEVFKKLKYSDSGEKFSDIEENFYEAIQDGNSKKAELMVAKMAKMIICAKLAEIDEYDAQTIMDNIDIPTLISFGDEGTPFIKFKDIKVLISTNDNDQINRLVINYINSILKYKGYNRQYTATDRYTALKEIVLASEKFEKKDPIFEEPYIKVSSFIDSGKVKALSK